MSANGNLNIFKSKSKDYLEIRLIRVGGNSSVYQVEEQMDKEK